MLLNYTDIMVQLTDMFRTDMSTELMADLVKTNEGDIKELMESVLNE